MPYTPRAAVAPIAFAAVSALAPRAVEVLELTAGIDLSAVEFLVPQAGDRSIIAALPSLEQLQVLQVMSAGTDWIEPHVPDHVILCNARGARDGPVAEWVLGALLGASTRLLQTARERAREKSLELEDLSSWTVVIVGMGSIGRLVGERLQMLGATVVGVASTAREDLHGVDELPALLPGADAVVMLTPLTPATHGLIGASELQAMRDGAVVVNAARGQVIDTDALLAEVTSGRLRAVLDVTDPEPLPAEHPLWKAPGVLSITPHIAGDSPVANRRAAILAGEQLARWALGEPLRNVVLDAPR
jgi:phosphoglycerate dehydrogenase-like enzyme